MAGLLLYILETALLIILMRYLTELIINKFILSTGATLLTVAALSVMTGALVAFMGYKPFGLLIALLLYNHLMLSKRAHIKPVPKERRPLVYISSYSYIILACALSWVLQIPMAGSGQGEEPLWRYLLAGSH